MASTEQLAYMAGYFDGEGSIYITGPKRYATIKAGINSADLSTLKLFQATFGGRLKPVPKRSKNRLQYSWVLSGPQAQKALEALEPFLIAKRLSAVKAQMLRYHFAGHGIPPWQLRDREEVYNFLKAFNHRKNVRAAA